MQGEAATEGEVDLLQAEAAEGAAAQGSLAGLGEGRGSVEGGRVEAFASGEGVAV